MTTQPLPELRRARPSDIDQLLPLWGQLFGEVPTARTPWREHARAWFGTVVDDLGAAWLPVIEIGDDIVGCAVATLELGVPNPQCPRGRAVRLANVMTVHDHRRRGHASALIDSVVRWARSIQADRVDLSATPEGRHLYERSGFVPTSAPRMKLVL